MSLNQNEKKNEKSNCFTFDRDQVICENFHLIEKIIGGYFGELWLAKHILDGSYAAVKIELQSHTCAQLGHEYNIYQILGKHPGIPEVYGFTTLGKFNLLVMELLGPSLQDLYDLYDHKFNLHTIVEIGLQILDLIEYVHSKNLIHRDIKPENFLVGREDNKNIIYLVDFGLSKYFIDQETNEHIKMKRKGISGTPRFMSLNANLGNEQSRRDDLEAIGYMLVYFLFGKLPWQNLEIDSWDEKLNTIAEIKRKSSKQIYPNQPEELTSYFVYVRKLTFSQEPSYEYLRGLIRNLYKKMPTDLDDDFEWIK